MTTPPRPLSSLTEEEAYKYFDVAFLFDELDYISRSTFRQDHLLEVSAYIVGDMIDRIDLTIWVDGQMGARGYLKNKRKYSPLFYAPALVDYLRSLGIHFKS